MAGTNLSPQDKATQNSRMAGWRLDKETDQSPQDRSSHSFIQRARWLLVVGLGLLASGIAILIANTPLGGTLGYLANILFKTDTVQAFWYMTRSAGLMAYFLLFLSSAWGLAVSSKILDNILHRTFTYDFHQFLSLLAVGFIFLHVVVLMMDQYLPFSIAQVLVPFIDPYRPLWVGIGIISFYLTILVTITFYLRSRIGMKTFRSIHGLSLVAYLGSTVHGFFSGTDSPLLATRLLYIGSFLVIVFLTSYWFLVGRNRKPLPVKSSSATSTPVRRVVN
ncbi:MAG: ferric reductase-like transmembrane domain-containing protein [Chloroflexi bacterium]|nr:ferric reductase-like transmembrane domain-containing protein [Chloroflexota bacterium]